MYCPVPDHTPAREVHGLRQRQTRQGTCLRRRLRGLVLVNPSTSFGVAPSGECVPKMQKHHSEGGFARGISPLIRAGEAVFMQLPLFGTHHVSNTAGLCHCCVELPRQESFPGFGRWLAELTGGL